MDKRKIKREALASEQARKECSVPPGKIYSFILRIMI